MVAEMETWKRNRNKRDYHGRLHWMKFENIYFSIIIIIIIL